MKDSLILEQKIYISARRAAELTGYASDYVGQLCRSGKIESKLVGRTWFVSQDSLLRHKLINDEVKTNKKTAWKRRLAQQLHGLKAASADSYKPDNNFGITGQHVVASDTKVIVVPEIISPARTAAHRADTQAAHDDLSEVKIRIEPASGGLNTEQSSRQSDNAQSAVDEKISGPAASAYSQLQKESINAPLVYSNEEIQSPFLPELKKGNPEISDEAPAGEFPDFAEIVADASDTRQPAAAAAVPSRSFFRPAVASMVVAAIMLAGGALLVVSPALHQNGGGQQASVMAAAQALIQGIENTVSGTIAALFDRNQTVAIAPTSQTQPVTTSNAPSGNVTARDLGYNAMAVVPSTGSPTKDELVKQQIKSSFSDQVNVQPDQTGSSGIITPVFKKATGSDYVYVLVPISGADAPAK